MAPSKLSPTERAFRKREAARLRQQRCRERKRQANLKKKMEENKAAEMSASQSPPSTPLAKKVTKSQCHAPKQHQELPLPPLLKKPANLIRRFSSSQSQALNSCESFPSIVSDNSQSCDGSDDDVVFLPNGVPMKTTPTRSMQKEKIHIISPKSVATSICKQQVHSPYDRNNQYPIMHPSPSPPLLTVTESHEEERNAMHSMHKHQQSTHAGAPNNLELDVVDAMLSLKSESPRPTISHNVVPRNAPYMMYESNRLAPFFPTAADVYRIGEDHRSMHMERVMRAEALMQARGRLSPRFQYYHHER
jgi:hypothetical protein